MFSRLDVTLIQGWNLLYGLYRRLKGKGVENLARKTSTCNLDNEIKIRRGWRLMGKWRAQLSGA